MTKLPFAGATALITIKKNCCLYPSMSSCAASSCMSFPKALSAFATLASSPTGGAPPSCRFAFNYSEFYSHRRLNQKPLLPGNQVHFGFVPNVAAAWWSSRDLPLPRSNSVLRPLSPEPPHETNFPKPQTSIRLSARSPFVRLAPKKVLVLDPESVPTAIIFYFNHPLPARPLLSSHQAHRSIAYLMPPSDLIENP